MASAPDLISEKGSTLLGHPILEGWMLKKKRKKMQGFARRYFYLSQEPAVLSYSFSPNSRIRDSVLIKLASISISRKSRSIHIDSGGSLVMHIKTLSDPDFLRWTHTLQSLVTNGKLKECQRRPRQAPRGTSKALPRYSEFNRSDGGPSLRPVELSNLYHSVARMQAPLSMLEEVQNDLRELLFPAHSELLAAPQSTSQIQTRSPPTSSPQPAYSPTTSPKLQYSTPKGKKPHLFKHYSHHQIPTSVDSQKVYQTISEAVAQLKTEHLNLIDLINIHRTSMVSGQSSELSQPLHRAIPSSHTARNPRQSNNPFSSHTASASDYVTPSSSSHLAPRRRSSTLTKTNQRLLQEASELTGSAGGPLEDDGADSESDTIFHDAADDDLVFVDLDLINNGQETEAETTGNLDFSSANDSDSDCSSLSQEEEQDQAPTTKPFTRASPGGVPNPRENSSHQGPSSSSSSSASSSSSLPANVSLNQAHRPILCSQNSSTSSLHLPANLVVKRRTVLPSPVCGDEFSIFSMLKKNVGKDLSQISFPISFNEPLSATQKICEECEYVDELLTKAVKSDSDPMERLMYIASFVVSGFCHTKTRAIRKPFNPMLGETYECIRPEKGMNFLSEKVVHHPPMIAAYCEGKNWKLEINSSARQKFWGQSLEIIPEGLNRLTILNPKGSAESMDVYEWDKPSSFVRNLVSGTKYLEHIGKITITKQNSSEKATVEFKPGSTFGGEASRNKVEVKVYDREGRVAISVNGKWDSYLSRTDGNQKLFEAHTLPERSAEFYGLTQFAIELNELSEDLLLGPLSDLHSATTTNNNSSNSNSCNSNIKTVLPPSDSRLRPDLRLFEKGLVDQADLVKKSLEEKQRVHRRLPEFEGLLPAWFELDPEGKNWVYKGGYFEKRQKGFTDWADLDLF
ncbi:hypothetical protein PCANC_24185 [Puccinia coronata f. sp. avenae]|uniref:PH domain-containing protein n=1 Tax=Puccinia coronata f. sp. avenae TaxID=200324 RepID=A0A2N5TGG9_9BASI|nr:hypothetical protein PCANC_24185 [Puccinia coronata f. sp. avenae]PLW24590.1 hypothetical protein PCASD_06219 [Puccinia coronata f. sp. avenae]